jgi:hypothetical protein
MQADRQSAVIIGGQRCCQTKSLRASAELTR